ncbi:hypothetical protein NQ318_008053 [Aromia moschata]|uniref:Reverse transcriptase domain-containing protein n=1 Tax=Aromia moschata TaxID=1265417 RepID=A0AAV8XCR4_9CUCU|nr:hypothetical protein NQ318_008053 [Aromia moschata]
MDKDQQPPLCVPTTEPIRKLNEQVLNCQYNYDFIITHYNVTEIGHDIAYCLRPDSKWEVYDDLKDTRLWCSGSETVVLVYTYNGEYLQQHEGTAMCNSLSPFVANLFMSKFETEAKDKFEYFPRVWFRYVDDIFAIHAGRVKISSGYLKTCAETKTAAIGTFSPVPQSAGNFLWDLHACLWITEVIHVLVQCAQLKELLLLPKLCVKTQEPQLVTEHNLKRADHNSRQLLVNSDPIAHRPPKRF